MARTLLHRLDRLLRREPPLEGGPAELVLTFSTAPGGCFWVHARSREDEDGVQGRFRPPWDRLRAAGLAGRVRGVDRHTRPVGPGAGGGPAFDPHRAGQELFEALFADPGVRELYDDTRAAAPDGRFRLRLVLDPDDPRTAALHALPWELLFERSGGDLLAVENGLAVVRTLRLRQPAAAPELRRPLRVLVLLSGARELDLDRERRELEQVSRQVGGLEVSVERATDLPGLERLLEAGRGGRPFQVLHLAGHGSIAPGAEGGVVVWEPAAGRLEIAGRDLATLVKAADLQLVVVNACTTAELPGDGRDPFTGVAAALLVAGVPAVAAVQGKIRDEAAVTFSRAFYGALAAGESPEEAMAAARRELWKAAPRGLEWVKPVLFQGASPRRLAPWVLRTAAGLLGALVLAAGLAVAQSWRLGTRTLERRVEEAQSLLLDDRPGEAVRTLAAAFDAASWSPVPRAALAAAHATAAVAAEDLGHLRRAVEHAAEAARLEPDRAAHHYNLGALLARAGRPGDAAAPLARALAIDPGLADARNELGCVHLDLGDPEAALAVLESGLDTHPEHALLHKNAGRALLALGRAAEAVPLLERALALLPLADWPARAEAAAWLARAAAEAGDDALACAAIRRFRETDPQGVTRHAPDAARVAEAAGCVSLPAIRPETPGGLHAP
jgi:tetratricopeptide (TPR) repeat protein